VITSELIEFYTTSHTSLTAHSSRDPLVDHFREFLIQWGADFWSQLGEFHSDSQLKHARLTEEELIRAVNQMLDNFANDDR
jgi:hypothetical protein